ncbi:transposase [Streptomyces sp. NPDC014006]|uniref:transposase n=1 Tax=Streptomyces sp. NPDC014006 TaxID=3364870 RepID=UPI0036F91A10
MTRASFSDGFISWSDVPVRSLITDVMWDRIELLRPADPVRGRPRPHARCHRVEVPRTNSPWRDLPDELGSFQTAHKRLTRRAIDGTLEKILAAILVAADAVDDIGWTVSVDSTVVAPHQHAAGAPRKGPQTGTSRPTTHSDFPAAGCAPRST